MLGEPIALGAHDGEAGLEDPRVHDPAHGLTGCRFERVPEVRRLGVAELVTVEIVPYAGAERVGAEPTFEHAQHRPTLLVGERVEHAVGILGRDDLVLDRPGGLQRVDVERGGPAQGEVDPRLPLRCVRVDPEVLHERGEGLVEPDAVPPLHRHQVAEPHVRDLVHDRERGGRHLVEGHLLGIEQQPRLAERDAAEVLHSPEREVGERDQIAFRARIRDAVVVGEERDRERADIEREVREMGAARLIRHSHRDTARVDRLGDLERPHHPRDQIGRHRDRLAEPDADVAVGQRVARDLGAVRQREQPVGHDERHREDRFELRLVEARKRGAGVRGFELRRHQYPLVAAVVDVGAPVEAEQPGADLAVELELEPGVARLQRLGGRDHEQIGLGVDRERGRDRPATLLEAHQGDVELPGMEHDRGRRLGELEGDDDLTGIGRSVEIRGDEQLISPRPYLQREAVRGSWDRRHRPAA